jgi:hypothetical protein
MRNLKQNGFVIWETKQILLQLLNSQLQYNFFSMPVPFFKIVKTKKRSFLDCPQKVRHYLGAFLWKEKLSMITHSNLNV